MKLKPNTTLQSGKYRIIRVLGQGGFGITYLAVDTTTDRYVAIKEFFPKDFCGRDNTSQLTVGTVSNVETVRKLKDRFLKEARNCSKFNHPGIVKIHEVFEENNTAYYVMDYIEGENLNEMVKRNGALSEKSATEYIKKVAEALDYIHSQNMTHFDVKPANIVVRKIDNQPILIDFGLSKQYDVTGEATSTLMQAVSHGFSPIELYNAQTNLSFSPQTDAYSLGATYYFLLTGNVPPTASELIWNPLSFPAYVSSRSSKIVKRMMDPKRDERPVKLSVLFSDSNFKAVSEAHSNKENVINPVLEETQLLPTSQVIETKNNSTNSTKRIERNTNSSSNNIWWIVVTIVIIVIIVLIVMTTTSTDDSAIDTSIHQNEIVVQTEPTMVPQTAPTTITEPQTPVQNALSKTIRINEINYNASINVTAENGALIAYVSINGDRGTDRYDYNKSSNLEKIMDIYEGIVYFDAATALASYIVPDDNSYNSEFLKPTLKLLKKSADCFSRSRGHDPIAYKGAMDRYNMLSRLNPEFADDREDISIIAWGMSEHPVNPQELRFKSSE